MKVLPEEWLDRVLAIFLACIGVKALLEAFHLDEDILREAFVVGMAYLAVMLLTPPERLRSSKESSSGKPDHPAVS